MMGRALLVVGGLAVAMFIGAGALGFGQHPDAESLRLHLLIGFGAVLLLVLAQVWMLIFLWATRRVIRRTTMAASLDSRFDTASRRGVRVLAPLLVVSLVLAVATFAVGPEVLAGGVPEWLHAVLAGAALIVQIASLWTARKVLDANAADLRAMAALVERGA